MYLLEWIKNVHIPLLHIHLVLFLSMCSLCLSGEHINVFINKLSCFH
jgi:hypothetical protein